MYRPPVTFRMPRGSLLELHEILYTLRELGYSTCERVANGLIFARGKGYGNRSTRLGLEFDTDYPMIPSKHVHTRITDLGINNGSGRFDITVLFGPHEDAFSCLRHEPRDRLINLAFVYLLGNPDGLIQVTQSFREPWGKIVYADE